ncbi:Ktr system potassium uptake protein A [BD1-7 clade bacterium]|uniref:Ktr system potassium uptake protein A n=1 Tax=BD1-7 clade bacterium TaxID=2029982 RepID=A0A5S9PNZ0_9GAMM|nr:Ktr system potassium uptake protein A [BD1-7 clade bacterium]CAA0106184.1 Ktr system potassium uptake protein A [BD1-7 clade bacterium]CAA0125869.1 Ktr system potassium uptake protein A [BD1-7 clade bacterium]
MAKQIAVIGLGRFGESLCRELIAQGADVLAIDINEPAVQRLANDVTQAAIADTTDRQAIDELDLRNYDCVFVAIGGDMKSSILTTLSLAEAGIEKIWAKCRDDYHERVLRKVGASHVINPESSMGARFSRYILTNRLFDFLDLGDNLSIIEVEVDPKLDGKPFNTQVFKGKYKVSVLATKRDAELITRMENDFCLKQGDLLVLSGNNRDLYSALTKL